MSELNLTMLNPSCPPPVLLPPLPPAPTMKCEGHAVVHTSFALAR